jgi:mannose-6-phosphate isomerase-like protein (cupin superfamily)
MNRVYVALFLASFSLSLAQQAPIARFGKPFEQRSAEEIQKQAAHLLADAEKSPSGSSGVKLEIYPGHYTMLTARVKSGDPELHKNFSDFFFVLDGEATEIVGGTLVDPSEVSPGELHGSSIVGGQSHEMRKGGVIHILPNVPHQTIVARGKSFTYYVIKVEAPK